MFSALWLLIVLVLSTISKSNIAIEEDILLPHADKLAHFGMYFVLQILLLWQFENRSTPKIQRRIFFAVCIYGIVIELTQQLFLADRFFEIFDIIANITGALVGKLFFQYFKT